MYLIYPLLLCLFPVHSHYAQNISEISLSEYVKTLTGILLIVLAGVLGINLLVKNIHLSCLIFSIIFFVILNANYFYIGIFSKYKQRQFRNKILFVFSMLFFCMVTGSLVFFLLKDFNLLFLSKILFYFTSFFSFFVIVDLIKKYLSFYKNIDLKMETAGQKDNNKPDIYHIILDAHPGFAVPEFCDNDFKKALEQRGFCIYENFKSNYTRTNLSIPSMLNMKYVDDIVEKPLKAYFPDDILGFYKQNFVFSFFREKKYRFTIFANKFFNRLFEKEFSEKTDYIYNYKFQNELLKILFFSSLFAIFYDTPNDNFRNEIKIPIQTLKKKLIIKSDKPTYAYMHFLAPHTPFFCDENGNLINKNDMLNVKNYFPYTKFIDKEILELIDEILANMKKNSLIILHSDHGLHELKSRHNILMAVHYPDEQIKNILPENGTLVNFFRCILNKYFGTDFEILEDKFYDSNITDFIVYEDSID